MRGAAGRFAPAVVALVCLEATLVGSVSALVVAAALLALDLTAPGLSPLAVIARIVLGPVPAPGPLRRIGRAVALGLIAGAVALMAGGAGLAAGALALVAALALAVDALAPADATRARV